MNHLGVWAITVGGYGMFEYVATEEEAEAMRVAKANWEQAVGHKSRLRDASELELVVWNESGGPFTVDDEEGASKVKSKSSKKRASKP